MTSARLVSAVTVAAIVVALLVAAVRSGTRAGAGPTPAEGAVPTAPAAVADLRDGAIDVRPLPGTAERALFRQCTRPHPEAQAAETLDPARLTVVATGTTTGAGIELWRGPAPGTGDALGSCVGLDRAGGWTLVSRSWRAYPDVGDVGLVWQPAAGATGGVASLGGRVHAAVTTALVRLEDGRVLRAAPEDGLLAAAWTPISPPQRLVLLGTGDRLLYDGPFLEYGR